MALCSHIELGWHWPVGTKPLPEPVLANHRRNSVASTYEHPGNYSVWWVWKWCFWSYWHMFWDQWGNEMQWKSNKVPYSAQRTLRRCSSFGVHETQNYSTSHEISTLCNSDVYCWRHITRFYWINATYLALFFTVYWNWSYSMYMRYHISRDIGSTRIICHHMNLDGPLKN